jgi:hypothetical protein
MQSIRDAYRIVGKAVHSLNAQQFRAEVTEHHPATCGAEINRGHPPRLAHLKKAAATPASTGMCRPVVWLRSAEQSTKTAFATFSGNTSRLSSVREA